MTYEIEKEYGNKFEIRPYGMSIDIDANEDTYSHLVYHHPKGKSETVFASTVMYPYAFIFMDDDHDSFVFHALIHYQDMPNELVRKTTENEINAMNEISLKINTMKGKLVLVNALKKVLEENIKKGIHRLEEQKCLEHLNWYIEKYKEASFDCEKLRIVPLHMNLRSDMHGVLRQFLPGDPHRHVDEIMEKSINDTYGQHNVETRDGVEIELDRFVTMTVDQFPTATVHKDKIGEKSYHDIIVEKNIGIYDLYTFVVQYFDFTTGEREYEFYSIFWDGDVPEYDESTEILDEILLPSELGYQKFVEVMSRNKTLPNGMYGKFMEGKLEHAYEVTGAYKVDIRNTVNIDFKLLNDPHANQPEPAQF